MGHVALADLRRAIRELGLSGRCVCVHSSLRSFGHVEGRAETVVEAFLAEECTLIVPAFSWTFFVPPLTEMRPPRNTFDYEQPPAGLDGGRIYTPTTNEIDSSMGAVARSVVERPGRARGDHPLNSFAAVGPRAERLVGGQQALDVYAPLRTLSERGGFVLLIGVGLTCMTLLHFAEARAGRQLFRRWAKAPSGDVIEVETGSCSAGFDAFEPVLAPLARETWVGASRWRAFPAGKAVDAAARAIEANPRITDCPDSACARCSDAIAGGPTLTRAGAVSASGTSTA